MPDDTHHRTLASVADAARRVNRAVRVTAADADTLGRAAESLVEAARLLEADQHPGPHCQVGHDTDGPPAADLEPPDFFPYSPIVGPLNPISPPVSLSVGDDKVVRGTVTLSESYNGPPWNLAHGGVIAAIFDELLGIATIVGAGGGFTGRLTVHYRKPTPILEELELIGWLEHASGRKLVARGEIRHRGEVTAEADGLFIQIPGVLQDHDGVPATVSEPG
jgi:acyl-coenzyme A thioesterase PaaI-like protein